jgi:ribose-phosphate pyrophosphokinase
MTNSKLDHRPVLFALPENESLTIRLAEMIRADLGGVTLHDFPDGESYVRIDSEVGSRDVAIVASLHQPNDKLLALLFLADALRELGAARVGLVTPYLAYMRQDARFRPGEAITSRTVASLLSARIDWLITVDPHLHRYASLDALYTVPSTAILASAEVGHWIGVNVMNPFIIGPDAESRQWVERIAKAANAPFTVLTKTRHGDTDVIESIPDLGVHVASTPVLVDDIISTGRTMAAAVRHLRDQGAHSPICLATHAVFAENAEAELRSAGAARIVTTNTIVHHTNAIDVAPLISAAIKLDVAVPSLARS